MLSTICFFPPSFTCIINKWHLDFIKVPRPLWQQRVTGGHFNISHQHLSWYYLRQPVAPKGSGGWGWGRREVPCLRLRLPGRPEGRSHRTVLNKSKCIQSGSIPHNLYFLLPCSLNIIWSQGNAQMNRPPTPPPFKKVFFFFFRKIWTQEFIFYMYINDVICKY